VAQVSRDLARRDRGTLIGWVIRETADELFEAIGKDYDPVPRDGAR